MVTAVIYTRQSQPAIHPSIHPAHSSPAKQAAYYRPITGKQIRRMHKRTDTGTTEPKLPSQCIHHLHSTQNDRWRSLRPSTSKNSFILTKPSYNISLLQQYVMNTRYLVPGNRPVLKENVSTAREAPSFKKCQVRQHSSKGAKVPKNLPGMHQYLVISFP